MGSGASHLIGCCVRPKNNGGSGDEGSGGGFQFSEPLDEGLGHSFCYVRPAPLGGYSPLHTPDQSEEFPPLFNSGGKHTLAAAPGAENEFSLDTTKDIPVAAIKDEKDNLQEEKSRASVGDRPRLSAEKPPRSGGIEKAKSVPETSFKAISGASVSANTATPRTMISCEQFNSFSNVLYDRAAAFESTSSFSAIPLQPVPRGFSGPLSGPLDRGFMSGPLERERGFMSGPLERGFMSGPLERGYMSGPLDASADRSHFSAPLNGPYHYNSYFRRRKRALVRIMASMSGPMKKALAKTASSIARTHRSIVAPVKNYMLTKDNSREFYDGSSRDKRGQQRSVDSIDPSVEFSSTDPDLRESDNLQWAQGKAGEDRVHVVLSEEHGWLFVGIYDGFNGPDAPDFLMSNLYPAVFQELKGLLWDPKEEEATISMEDAERIGEFNERDVLNDRQGNGSEQNRDGNSNSHVKDEFPEKVHMDRSSQQGGCSGVHDLDGNWECREGMDWVKSPVGVDVKEEDVPILSLDDSTDEIRREPNDGDDEIKGASCKICLKPGASHGGEDRNRSDLEGSIHGDSSQEMADQIAEVSGAEREDRLGLDREGKQAEDRGNGHVYEIEGERSSDQPEFIEASSISDQEHKLKKKRRSSSFKMRHDRRKDHFHQYFEWRYGWDQDMPGGMVQKVKNAKIAQEPDIPAKKSVEHCSVLKALARALETTENAYLDMADNVLYENPELALMGSCVLVMIMKDEDMYILNVGDSRAIVAQNPKEDPLNCVMGKGGRNGLHGNDSGARDSLLRLELERIIEETPLELEALEASYENGTVGSPLACGPSLLGALQLTTDHSTNIEEEVLRLKAEHPDDDIFDNERVKGKLKVTRAFGAGFLKQPKWNNALLEMFQINFIGESPYITCSPALYHHRLGPRDQFLVLSSDGLYQYFSNEEVVAHVEWFMKKFPDGDPAQHLIEELLFRAAKKAGMDFHELLDIPQGDRRKYHDDVSLMVISLEGRIWRSSG